MAEPRKVVPAIVLIDRTEVIYLTYRNKGQCGHAVPNNWVKQVLFLQVLEKVSLPIIMESTSSVMKITFTVVKYITYNLLPSPF